MPAPSAEDTVSKAPGRGHRHWAVGAVGVALVVVGAAYWLAQPSGSGASEGPPDAGSATTAPASAAVREAARAPWVPGAPRRVLIPALAVDVPVLPVKAPGGTLVPPSDPQQLGWWAAGAKPGAAHGSALITGHTVHTGGGALDDLETLRPGDRVTVRTDRGRILYLVQRVHVYSKGSVAKHAQRLFSQEVPGRLVLVTCEDWDGTRYLSNVVVVGKPQATRR